MGEAINKRLDPKLLISAGVLVFMGLITLASSGGELLYRQMIWLIPAIVLAVGVPMFINIRALLSYRWLIFGFYFFTLGLLIITYFVAPVIGGNRAWIVMGPLQIQPGEFVKASLIILLASFFAVRHVAIRRLGIVFASLIYAAIPFLLILLQPDLGTGLVVLGIWFGYLLVSGIRARHLIIGLVILSIVGALAWSFALQDYQKARVVALFTPEADPLGINYSGIQSRIAIGSGGLWGKGFGQGTQVHFGFLPAAHTDFIFSTFVEEWGMVGAILLVLAFAYIIYRVLFLGMESDNNLTRFISLGTALMLMIHFVINVGSATGIMPIIGVGLPLVSYGGSNLVAVALLLGVVQAMSDRKIRE